MATIMPTALTTTMPSHTSSTAPRACKDGSEVRAHREGPGLRAMCPLGMNRPIALAALVKTPAHR
jgi:hypothetical protein